MELKGYGVVEKDSREMVSLRKDIGFSRLCVFTTLLQLECDLIYLSVENWANKEEQKRAKEAFYNRYDVVPVTITWG